MNRMVIRGVTAGCVLGGLLLAVALAGTALAAGDAGATAGIARDTRGLAPHLPMRTGPVVAVPRPRPPAHRASRSAGRAPLAGSPREIAQRLLARRAWGAAQWHCLDVLWTRESGWQVFARNARSGAYGIPQALPGWKMASMGSDWRTNAVTQIRWGLSYIASTYGSPCSALAHSNGYGYY